MAETVATTGPNMSYQILRLPAVISITGLARSTIYAKIAEGQFPKPVNLSARSVGWLETTSITGSASASRNLVASRVARRETATFSSYPSWKKRLEWHAVTQEQVDNIESQSFIWHGLLLSGVSRLGSPPGGGKTTIALQAASDLSADGYDVFFSS